MGVQLLTRLFSYVKIEKEMGHLYFVMKDYGKSDFNKVGIYIDELPMDLGLYDSFRLTCIETMETIIMRTIPTDTSKRTKTVVFHDLDELDTLHVIVEYRLIGDVDYTFVGNYVFDVLIASTISPMIVNGETVMIAPKGGVAIGNDSPSEMRKVVCEVNDIWI